MLRGDKAYIFECGSNGNRSDHQQPVCHWYIHLSMVGSAGVPHADWWEVTHIHDLEEELECTRYQSL
jgi:hypothetical protein